MYLIFMWDALGVKPVLSVELCRLNIPNPNVILYADSCISCLWLVGNVVCSSFW
jgi:hypothetical protein